MEIKSTLQRNGRAMYQIHLDSDSEIYKLEDQHFGLCTSCGNDQYSCEPDALGYVCESCGKQAVYGVMHLAMGNRIIFPEEPQDV